MIFQEIMFQGSNRTSNTVIFFLFTPLFYLESVLTQFFNFLSPLNIFIKPPNKQTPPSKKTAQKVFSNVTFSELTEVAVS